MTMLSNPDTSRGRTARMPAVTFACRSPPTSANSSGQRSAAAANPVLDSWAVAQQLNGDIHRDDRRPVLSRARQAGAISDGAQLEQQS